MAIKEKDDQIISYELTEHCKKAIKQFLKMANKYLVLPVGWNKNKDKIKKNAPGLDKLQKV